MNYFEGNEFFLLLFVVLLIGFFIFSGEPYKIIMAILSR